MNRTPVQVHSSNEGSPLKLFTVNVTTAEGRRYWYCYPDGKPRDGFHCRELTAWELETLCNGIRVKGGIDTSLSCWQQGDPVYGSLAYERDGCEMEMVRWERDFDRVFG